MCCHGIVYHQTVAIHATFVPTDKEHVLRMEECFHDTRSTTIKSSRPSPAPASQDPSTKSSPRPPSAPLGNGPLSGPLGNGTSSGPSGNDLPSVSPPVSMTIPSGFQYVMVPTSLTTTVPQVSSKYLFMEYESTIHFISLLAFCEIFCKFSVMWVR